MYFLGFLIPACLMVATSYVGCNNTTLAVVLFSLALGITALNKSSYIVNHLDIAPRYAGVLMGITNTFATIPGMVGPYVVGYLTNNEVRCSSLFVFNVLLTLQRTLRFTRREGKWNRFYRKSTSINATTTNSRDKSVLFRWKQNWTLF